ncbi:MAG: hypothetical protein EXQ92_12430 [Alphaproteobacteria bacterium]|nr:hypothetical protein [Alphaproteobacteria bacterium]
MNVIDDGMPHLWAAHGTMAIKKLRPFGHSWQSVDLLMRALTRFFTKTVMALLGFALLWILILIYNTIFPVLWEFLRYVLLFIIPLILFWPIYWYFTKGWRETVTLFKNRGPVGKLIAHILFLAVVLPFLLIYAFGCFLILLDWK